MFSLSTLLIVATLSLIAGSLITLLLTRTMSSSEQKARALEGRLQEAEATLSNYQQEVTEHFAETAKLVNNLTQNYKEVHEHLASDALKLANIDISRQMLSNGVNETTGEMNVSEEDFQPPKDWAPSDGTLREDYGLDAQDAVASATVHAMHEAPTKN